MKKRRLVNRRKNARKTTSNSFNELWVIIVLVVIIILYYISLGKINLIDTERHKNRLQGIEDRLAALNSDIQNKRQLKEKLDKRVKTWFLIARCILGGIYLLTNTVVFLTIPKEGFYEKLSSLLDLNQAFLLLLLTVLFIRYETASDFSSFNKLIHLLVQKVVYYGHTQLSGELEQIEHEINELTKEKDAINSQLATNVEIDKEQEVPSNKEENESVLPYPPFQPPPMPPPSSN